MSDIRTTAEEVKSTWSKAIDATVNATKNLTVDAIGLGGAAAVSYGTYQIYQPAAYVVGGLAAVIVAWLLGKRMAK